MREVENAYLDKQIKHVYKEHRGRYGYRRICEQLKDKGLRVSLERIRRRMKKQGLWAVQARQFKRTTNSQHNRPIAANLLKQNFCVERANVAWVADMTYIRVKSCWLYLAVVLDLYSRKVIGWAFGERITTQLATDALASALAKRQPQRQVIVHTDRGIQYCSKQYQALIKANGLQASMSAKGNCYDNAACESFFHTLKVELIYQRDFADLNEARTEIFYYIEAYYNRKRKHSTIGYLSPVDYELARSHSAA